MYKKYTLAVSSQGLGVVCTETGNKNKNTCSLDMLDPKKTFPTLPFLGCVSPSLEIGVVQKTRMDRTRAAEFTLVEA